MSATTTAMGMAVFVACILPGIIVGGWIGALAHAMRSEAIWHRLFVMFGICVALVGLLGGWGELEHLIGPVLIPSAVGCLILERRTRAPAEGSLPTAATCPPTSVAANGPARDMRRCAKAPESKTKFSQGRTPAHASGAVARCELPVRREP